MLGRDVTLSFGIALESLTSPGKTMVSSGRGTRSSSQVCVTWLSCRPEDFPVMPVETVGFSLKPCGFFDGNPATDLPFLTDERSTLANGNCCVHGSASQAANDAFSSQLNGVRH